jgi:hypothetical protein
MGNGTAVIMHCWTDSQWIYPPNTDHASPRWFGLYAPWSYGYPQSALVETQTSVGHAEPSRTAGRGVWPGWTPLPGLTSSHRVNKAQHPSDTPSGS